MTGIPNAHGRIGLVDLTGAALLTLALLLPVGDAPWFSFWREWMASIAVLLLLLGVLATLRSAQRRLDLTPGSLPSLALGLSALCWVQSALGYVPYFSDAFLASLYLLAFAICIAAPVSLPAAQRDALADRLAAALATAAIVSAPIAVLQWLGLLTLDLGMPVAGGRPVAHMEQANLLCSLLIQGLAGIWRLQARGRLGRLATALGIIILLPVVVLTQSRVAWLVAAAAVALVLWRRDIVPMRSTGRVILLGAVAVFLGGLLLPALDSSLGIPGASLAERSSAGRRPELWALFLDALAMHPFVGWGVLQNGTAQYALAQDHPSLGWYFSSAHNIVLDLAVWFGIPIGLLAGGALFVAVGRRVAHANSTARLATSFAAAALLLHALVELPLHYAYFLLPLGLLIGTSTSNPAPDRWRVGLPPWPAALAIPWMLVLALLAHEYITLTDVRPTLAIDRASRHLLLTAEVPAPEVKALDRLHDFHVFAAIPLRDGVPATALDLARSVMISSPYAPVIERAALVAGLNGRTAEAEEALARLCRFEPASACARSEAAWAIWRAQWPELPPWPATPGDGR